MMCYTQKSLGIIVNIKNFQKPNAIMLFVSAMYNHQQTICVLDCRPQTGRT